MHSPSLLPPPPLPPPPLAANELPVAPPLPSFSLLAMEDEPQPQRGEDYDLGMGMAWTRGLSVSPRMYPTYASSSAQSSYGMGMGEYGYRAPGEGLSPMLGPTLLGTSTSSSSHHHGTASGSGSGGSGGTMLMASGQGGAYGYDYALFGQYHTSPPVGAVDGGGIGRGGSGRSQSFSNVGRKLREMSPQSLLPPPRDHASTPQGSHKLVHATSDPLPSGIHSSPTHLALPLPLEVPTSTSLPATPLASTSAISTTTLMTPEPVPIAPLQYSDMSPVLTIAKPLAGLPDANAEEEDPRIRAYAKLEFPTFDIYIQKLSVIIGRRPAVVVPPSPVVPLAVDGGAIGRSRSISGSGSVLGRRASSIAEAPVMEGPASEEERVKMEEFLMGGLLNGEGEDAPKADAGTMEPPTPTKVVPAKEEDVKVKVEEPSNAIEFSEFLKSSPSLGPTPSTSLPVLPPVAALDLVTPPLPVTAVDVPLPPSPPLPVAPLLPVAPVITTDIDLGPIRAVSRQHARLYFDTEMGGWALEVLGRNGVVVEGTWRAKGEKQVLGKRTKIQIAERIFYFVLPTIDPPTPPPMPVTLNPKSRVRSNSLSSYASSLSSNSSSESGDERADRAGDESSSLSELSDSDFEEAAPVPEASSSRRVVVPAIRITNSWTADDSYSNNGASDSGSHAWAPPIRAASKGVVYGRDSAVGIIPKKVSSGKMKGGKGKGKAAGKGKNIKASVVGAAPAGKGKGKTTLPPPPSPRKSLRRGSNHSMDSFSGRSGNGYNEDGMDEDSDDDDESDDPFEDRFVPTSAAAALAKKKVAAAKQPKKVPRKGGKAPVHHPVVAPLPPAAPVAPVIAVGPPPTALAGPIPVISAAVLPPLPFPLPPNATVGPQAANVAGLPALPPNRLPVRPVVAAVARPVNAVAGPVAGRPALPPLPAGAVTRPVAMPGVAPAVIMVDGVPVPPVKRGRGRPPKNGICAQRPRKPKPDPAIAAAAGNGSIDPSLAPGYVAGEGTGTFTPAVYPDGERPPEKAPEDDRFAKPPYTYASLIAQAVSSAEFSKLTLNGIYDWITARWPYFSDNQNGWQNSIRHNLTLSRGFLKVPRRADEPGKGAFWSIDPAQMRNFDGLHFRKKNTKGPAGPVVPKPAKVVQPKAAAPKPKPVVAPNRLARPAQSAPSLSSPLPIIIAPIPASYVRPIPPVSATPPDELTAALLRDPPIVLHEGRLILNPTIFAPLTKAQLDNLQSLPASQALQILQQFVVQHFKEKMRRMAMEKERIAVANGAAPTMRPQMVAGPGGAARPAGAVAGAAASTSGQAVRPAGAVAGAMPQVARPAGAAPLTAARPATTATSLGKPVVAPTAASAAAAVANGKRKLEGVDAGGPIAKVPKVEDKKVVAPVVPVKAA